MTKHVRRNERYPGPDSCGFDAFWDRPHSISTVLDDIIRTRSPFGFVKARIEGVVNGSHRSPLKKRIVVFPWEVDKSFFKVYLVPSQLKYRWATCASSKSQSGEDTEMKKLKVSNELTGLLLGEVISLRGWSRRQQNCRVVLDHLSFLGPGQSHPEVVQLGPYGTDWTTSGLGVGTD